MNKISRNNLRLQRKKRIRAKIEGTESTPRLGVFRSLLGIYVQAIDDKSGKVLAAASLGEIRGKNDVSGAGKVGELIAKKCLEKKITQAVFDRSGYKYHGKVKALAEGARKGGLKF